MRPPAPKLPSLSINLNSLRVKVIAGIILPMIIMLGVFVYIEYTHHRAVLLDNLTRLASYNGRLIEETLQQSMLNSNFADLQGILDTVGQDSNFRVVYFLDPTGKVIFSPNGKATGTQLSNLSATCQPCHKLPPADRPAGVVVTDESGQRVFRSMDAIENGPACTRCHDPNQKILGTLLTDISVDPFEAAFLADLRQNLLWGGSTVLVSALIAYFVISHLVVRRVRRVADALVSFDSNSPGAPIDTGSLDEIGQLELDFDEMARRIQAEEKEIQALSRHLSLKTAQQQELLGRLITAQEEERRRVARELHDELGQSLGGLALHSEAVSKYLETNPKQARDEISLIRKQIGITTDQMYELIMDLRPSVLDDLGLEAALRTYAGRVLKETHFSLDASGLSQRLPPAIEVTLYRIFQEALSNVTRHARAREVSIRLAQQDGMFEGEVVDDGQGFNLEDIRWESDSPHGLGLLGMKERLVPCGGELHISSNRGQGTRIRIRIPLEEGCHE